MSFNGYTWTSYDPEWTGSVSDPAIGDGTKEAWYIRVGDLVHYHGRISMGAATTYGSGEWFISVPITGSLWTTVPILCFESGVGQYSAMGQLISGGVKIGMRANIDGQSTLASLTGTVPFTWGDADVLKWSCTYEAA